LASRNEGTCSLGARRQHQRLRRDGAAARQPHGLADPLAQLGDVALPRLGEQRVARLGREADHAHAGLLGEQREEVRRQRQHVFAPRGERRELDGVVRDPERQLAEVAIRRRHDARAHGQLVAAAFGPERALGQRARERSADARGEPVEAFQQQRAAGRALQGAREGVRQRGIGARDAAEQLARLQRLGHRGADQRLERRRRVRAPCVDRARQHRLAGAGRSRDDHGLRAARSEDRAIDRALRSRAGGDDAILAPASGAAHDTRFIACAALDGADRIERRHAPQVL
jgi:hypothetical protein